MKTEYKRFCRKAELILQEFQDMFDNNNKWKMNCIKYILTDIRNGQYKSAFRVMEIESDKIRHTPYAKILVKYKIYKDLSCSRIDFDIHKLANRRKYFNTYSYRRNKK